MWMWCIDFNQRREATKCAITFHWTHDQASKLRFLVGPPKVKRLKYTNYNQVNIFTVNASLSQLTTDAISVLFFEQRSNPHMVWSNRFPLINNLARRRSAVIASGNVAPRERRG